MRKMFLLLTCIAMFVTALVAADAPQAPNKGAEAKEGEAQPKCSEPWMQGSCGCNESWMKDQCDQTDTFGIPLDQSQEEDEQQLEKGENYHKKEKRKELSIPSEK